MSIYSTKEGSNNFLNFMPKQTIKGRKELEYKKIWNRKWKEMVDSKKYSSPNKTDQYLVKIIKEESI